MKWDSFTIGPPAGGGLYAKLGYRAPFIFGGVCIVLDLIGRILVIERKDALLWGIDPAVDTPDTSPNIVTETSEEISNQNLRTISDEISRNSEPKVDRTDNQSVRPEAVVNDSPRRLSLVSVISRLFRSYRALAALFIVLVYG